MNRDVAPLYAVPWHRIDSLCTSLTVTFAMVCGWQTETFNALILSPVVEDRLVLVPFQRNPGTNVLKSWPFMVVSRGAPKDSVRGKE